VGKRIVRQRLVRLTSATARRLRAVPIALFSFLNNKGDFSTGKLTGVGALQDPDDGKSGHPATGMNRAGDLSW
jgi:hypothetical protein